MTVTSMQGENKSVLIIDDDEFSRAILRKKLTLLGMTDIHEAINGRTAAVAMDRSPRPPDYLICDIFMPDMDGIEFVSELAKRNYQGGIILVTGVNRDMLDVAADIAMLKGLRVMGTFTKPVPLDSLSQALGIMAG